MIYEGRVCLERGQTVGAVGFEMCVNRNLDAESGFAGKLSFTENAGINSLSISVIVQYIFFINLKIRG